MRGEGRRRFATSHGSDRLLGNQICHWTMGTSETCMKVTNLVIFYYRPLAPMSFLNTVQRCLPPSVRLMMPPAVFPHQFFLSDGCMAQRGRCPGGRPSVSANKRIHDAYYIVVKWQLYKPSMNTEYDQQSPRECRYLYWRVQ